MVRAGGKHAKKGRNQQRRIPLPGWTVAIDAMFHEFPSLHHTLLTLLPPRSLCDFTSHRVHWTWLGLMPWRCWCAPPTHPLYLLLPDELRRSRSWSMPIHTICHANWMCCNSVMLTSVHMTSVASVHPGRGILLCCSVFNFFLRERVFSISWELFLIRCEDLGQGCRMCTDCNALWGKFVICDIGRYKINWIELKCPCWHAKG